MSSVVPSRALTPARSLEFQLSTPWQRLAALLKTRRGADSQCVRSFLQPLLGFGAGTRESWHRASLPSRQVRSVQVAACRAHTNSHKLPKARRAQGTHTHKHACTDARTHQHTEYVESPQDNTKRSQHSSDARCLPALPAAVGRAHQVICTPLAPCVGAEAAGLEAWQGSTAPCKRRGRRSLITCNLCNTPFEISVQLGACNMMQLSP